MRAVVLHRFGAADELRLESTPDATERTGWVVVQVRASALNWHDVLVRQGVYRSPLPHVPGADGAGVRRDTGEPVVVLPSLHWGTDQAAPSAGFQILGDVERGTYAELVAVPAECAVPKPPGLSWAQAAALPLVGVTTFRALFTRGRLAAGESLLVLGASGGVATSAVTLAAAAGARVVVTSSSPDKVDRAKALGAADGVLHTEHDWVDAARRCTPGNAGFDLVLDPVGRWNEAVRALRRGGRLVVLGASVNDTARMDVRSFYFGQYDLLGTTMGSPADFAGLLSFMAETNAPPPVIDRTFPLDAAADAHRHLESGAGFGKVVLDHV
ncbi:zinc-binding dehydrogenase [Labedaea rhizosphaerae]|uniref:NADPH:quinone reductase-like Zn-dependent oxidoreductase n=1 Tax=Labedaea rhizosphaerae TaxID=598644 RepID=A0A4R6RXU4_LABRH|nr:zinc-binding dehydrogenase [Labedaea rhizosphaerae]TDP91901.1 NADPH:quinone reductase-like Zn-dependent oxidoreductase [Labedaea rhizosphaerae]